MKFKTVLFDAADLFEREIEEVLEYYYEDLVQWVVIKYKDSPNRYTIPLFVMAIKHKLVLE